MTDDAGRAMLASLSLSLQEDETQMGKHLEMDSDAWSKEIDRIVIRTANRISAELAKMVVDLPYGAAPQMATALLVSDLVEREQWIMSLIMEDHEIREAYESAVARLPATARPRERPKPVPTAE